MVRDGKAPIGVVEPVVFLDVDGVLNAHEYDRVAMSNPISRELMRNFNAILEATGAVVVLSSAWRYIVHRGEATLGGMDWLLRSHGMMADRLVGVTRPDTMVPSQTKFDGSPRSFDLWPLENERGQQIADWRLNHSHRGRHVVLDDGGRDRTTGDWSGLGIPEAGHPVVWTDSRKGLTPADVQLAIVLLNGEMSYHGVPIGAV